MKRMLVGLCFIQMCMVQADDGFYTRAMSPATDGTYDPSEGFIYPNTIGFQTHPDNSSKKNRVDKARATDATWQENQSKKKQGKLSSWIHSWKKS